MCCCSISTKEVNRQKFAIKPNHADWMCERYRLVLFNFIAVYGFTNVVRKYLYFFAPNTHCALVVALSEKRKYLSVWLYEM